MTKKMTKEFEEKKNGFVDMIENASTYELLQLYKACRSLVRAWGFEPPNYCLTPSQQVVEEPVVDTKVKTVDLVLNEVDNKLKVIKALKELLKKPLMECKKMTESVPVVLMEQIDVDEAERLVASFEEKGVSVEIK